MVDGIILENGIEWWLSEDKTTWYSRKAGTEDWAADPSGKGPRSSRVVTKLEDLEDRFEVIESVTTADGTKVEVIGYPALPGCLFVPGWLLVSLGCAAKPRLVAPCNRI